MLASYKRFNIFSNLELPSIEQIFAQAQNRQDITLKRQVKVKTLNPLKHNAKKLVSLSDFLGPKRQAFMSFMVGYY